MRQSNSQVNRQKNDEIIESSIKLQKHIGKSRTCQ